MFCHLWWNNMIYNNAINILCITRPQASQHDNANNGTGHVASFHGRSGQCSTLGITFLCSWNAFLCKHSDSKQSESLYFKYDLSVAQKYRLAEIYVNFPNLPSRYSSSCQMSKEIWVKLYVSPALNWWLVQRAHCLCPTDARISSTPWPCIGQAA